MPVPAELEVRLTRDRFEKPLVIVESALGNGMAASPEHLRALAAALLLAATAAEARPTKVKYFADASRKFIIKKPTT